MKTLYLTLLCGFLSIGSGWGQRVRLRGGYVLVSDGGGAEGGREFFYFSKSRFIHYSSSDTGAGYGSGTYQLKGDSLFLRFDDWQLRTPDVTSDPSFRADTSADGVTVRVLDAIDKLQMPGVAVRSVMMPTVATSTDVFGLAKLDYPLLPADSLVIESIAYRTEYVKPGMGEGRHFLVRLHPSYTYHITGNTRYSFSVKRSIGHSLLLRGYRADYQTATSRQTRYYLNRYKELAK